MKRSTLILPVLSLLFVSFVKQGWPETVGSPTNPLKASTLHPNKPIETRPPKGDFFDEDVPNKKLLDKKQIRKLISSEPDPSMVLEPPPEPPKKETVKGPPPRPTPQAANLPPINTPDLNGTSSALARIPGQVPLNPEVAIILVNKEFYPAKVRLKGGVQTRLFFTTTNEKPAAVIVEQLQIQRWVAKENEMEPQTESERAKWEAAKEVSRNRVTEITVEPRKGTYIFLDAITGAKGQLIVE